MMQRFGLARVTLAGVMLAASCGLALAVDTGGTVASWLQDGYEVKAAFSDNSGGAYVILQKGTSAYLCHSAPARCEKLN